MSKLNEMTQMTERVVKNVLGLTAAPLTKVRSSRFTIQNFRLESGEQTDLNIVVTASLIRISSNFGPVPKQCLASAAHAVNSLNMVRKLIRCMLIRDSFCVESVAVIYADNAAEEDRLSELLRTYISQLNDILPYINDTISADDEEDFDDEDIEFCSDDEEAEPDDETDEPSTKFDFSLFDEN